MLKWGKHDLYSWSCFDGDWKLFSGVVRKYVFQHHVAVEILSDPLCMFCLNWWWQADTLFECLPYSLREGNWSFLEWVAITDVLWQVLRFYHWNFFFTSDERSMASLEYFLFIWNFYYRNRHKGMFCLLSPDWIKFTILWTIHWSKLF